MTAHIVSLAGRRPPSTERLRDIVQLAIADREREIWRDADQLFCALLSEGVRLTAYTCALLVEARAQLQALSPIIEDMQPLERPLRHLIHDLEAIVRDCVGKDVNPQLDPGPAA